MALSLDDVLVSVELGFELRCERGVSALGMAIALPSVLLGSFLDSVATWRARSVAMRFAQANLCV